MKILSAVLLLVLLACNVSAQESKFRLGLTLSPQLDWMTAGSTTIKKNGSYFGFCYGLLLDIKFQKNYALSTGIIISHEGGKLTYLDSTKFNSFPDLTFPPGTNVDYRFQYVEIPLTIKLMTNQIGYITYYGQFGLDGAVNFRSRADITTLNNSLDKPRADFGDDVTPANFGLLVGGGLEYQITGNTSLLAGLQYFNGFIDVTDNPNGFKTKSALDHLRLTLGVFF